MTPTEWKSEVLNCWLDGDVLEWKWSDTSEDLWIDSGLVSPFTFEPDLTGFHDYRIKPRPHEN